MRNDARSTRKSVDDESSNGLKKKSSGGKNDSSASVSGSVSGEPCGLRRSTRSQSNSSPGSIRKSQRLEKRVPETGTNSLLRRSARDNNKLESLSSGKGSPSMTNKGSKQHSKGGLRTPEAAKRETAQKGVAKEAQVMEKEDSSPVVGEKRKRRLNARQYKAMFATKNAEILESKKRRLENSYDIEDSCLGDLGEGTSENSEKCLDSSHLKSEKGLQVNCNEQGGSVSGNADEGLQDKCDEDADRGVEEPDEEPQECSDEEEMEGDCAANADGGTEGEYLDVKETVCAGKPCDLEVGEGQQVSRDPSIRSLSTPETQAEKSSVNVVVGKVGVSMVEKISNQEIPLGSGRTSGISNGSICDQKASTIGSSVVDGEVTHTNMKVFASVSPTCKMTYLAEECAKCSKTRRSDCNSPELELCACFSNSMSNAKVLSDSEGRGECSNAADEDGQKTNRSDPLVDAHEGSCVTCKRAGKLFRCSGKACYRSYHPSCLWTRGEKTRTAFWYCSECMKKKLALGVHSVSEGIESILDSREVEQSNSEGSINEKQYLVKYKGLAHIHNCWIAEKQLLQEAPAVLLKLSEQDTLWKPEWAVPQRLLLRRSIIVDKQESDSESKSQNEWLVKWRGLDYDQATWELEDSDFFKKPEAQQLLKEYEARHNGVRSSLQQLLTEYETLHIGTRCSGIFGDNKIQERRKSTHVKHGRFSDSLRFETVNKLREFYQKSHSVMLLDEQDRAMKIVYFIASVLSDAHRPFLIITPHESLSYWEAEFLRFTSSINVVVYGGNSESRKIIRSLEFDGKGGELMLQVLLSSVEDISEDLEEIKGMKWEAVIVDSGQENSISRSSGCIKTLATNWKVLLLNAQLKDNIVDYINILSLLEPVGSSNQCHGLGDIQLLQERLCSYIVSPRFQEYWVPVEISNVQLEQYCSSMLSNSTVLWSCCKSDPIGSLHAVLTSTQKCCDHPYIVNPLLRKLLLPEEPAQDAALDMGVKASGKLQLLDKLLSEFRNRGLKVLIVFQSIGGSGKDNLEIILEDFLTWRFGEDSYEQVAAGGQPGKRQAALNKFNREPDRSFLLLEARACLPSIKLSFVDSVIILNSDWNPLNDLRALQKIVIDSKLKPINVFRFYCSCTVEEKALIIAKSDTIADGSQQISPSTKQMLLMWGSSYLFSRLDKFHHEKVIDCRDNIALGSSLVTDVCQEIVSLVENHENRNPHRYISLARQDGRCYFTNTPLFGEHRTQLEDGVSSQMFWMKLLEGKQPQWKYLSGSSERNRKRVNYAGEVSLPRNIQADEPAKKRKDYSPRAAQNPVKPKDRNKEHHGHFDMSIVQQDDRIDLPDRRSLFELLKPTVLRLCETLVLKDEVKRLAERFLEFVLNNHQVPREPETVLQAFQISVCWTAAEVLEKKIDHRKSLDIARENMDFKCLEQEADTVYTKMKLVMRTFLSHNLNISKSSVDAGTSTQVSTRVFNGNYFDISLGSLEKTTGGLEKSTFAAECSNNEALPPLQMTNNESDSLGYAETLKKKCDKKIRRLKEKQNDEVVTFENTWEEKRVELEKSYKLETAVIRYSHAKSTAGGDKLKQVDSEYAKKKEDLESQIANSRKELETRLQEERDEEEKKIERLLELVKPMAQNSQLEKLPSVDHIQLQRTEDIGLGKDTNGSVSLTENLLQGGNSGELCGTHLPAMLPCNVDDTLSSDTSSHLSETQRAGCENSLDRVSAFQAAETGNLAGENNTSLDLSSGFAVETVPGSCRQDSAAGQCSEPAAGRGVDTTQIDVLVDKSSTAERDQGNYASTSLSMEQRIEDGTSCKGLGDGPSQSQVGGLKERVRPVTEIYGTSSGVETSLVDPVNPDYSSLPRDERTTAVSSTERSLPVSVRYDQTRGASSGQLNNQLNGVQMVAQTSFTQMQPHLPHLGVAHTVGANIRQGLTYVSAAAGASVARTSYPNSVPVVTPTISHVSASYNSDPLQNEYDRLRKEIAQNINAHEEMKLQLKSECDKEIEELVAQIRRKYDAKLDEAESSFAVKKKELDLNQNMVMMNKFLADAFRSKCMDYKAGPQGGTPKGLSSGPADLQFQLQPMTRPFSPEGSLYVPQTAPTNSTPPPVRGVHPSPILSSTVPSRTPPINSSSGRFQHARHEMRGAAPHLQHTSASSVPTSSNIQSSGVVPLQPTSNNLASSSSLQIPARQSQSLQSPCQPPAFQSTCGQPQQAETFDRQAAINVSLSATELLMGMARQNSAEMRRLSGNLPLLPDNIQNHESWDLSSFGRAVDVQQPGGDVVCLSDDD